MTEPNLLARMLALAVHEFRTPAAVMAGYQTMLLSEQAGPLTAKQRRILEESEKSCRRLSALIKEMSELVKIESQELALSRHDIDLSALVAEVANNMHEGAERGVHLEVRGTERPAIVSGDRVRMAEAIGGLVRCTMRERGTPGAVIAQCAVVQDSDTAWGVVAIGDAALVPAILEGHRNPPAFDEWRGGTGFVLPLARRIIEAHGGAVWSGDGTVTRAATGLKLPVRV